MTEAPPPPGFIPGDHPPPGYPPQANNPQTFYPSEGLPTPQSGYPPSYSKQDPYPKPTDQKEQPMSGYYSGLNEDPVGGEQCCFTDKAIRLGFIRKVYGILLSQLLITLAIVSLFTFNSSTQEFVQDNPSLWWIALGAMFVCLIVMACCGEVRRKSPANFIFLGMFTIAESFMLGCATVHYDSTEVVLAVGITSVLVFSLTMFAFQTKIDFTLLGGVILLATLILMLFGLCLAIFGTQRIVSLIYSCFGAFLFSVYIVYDTQLMIGGSHKYTISPEEYIFAALNLYLDIVNMFLYILTIIGVSRD